MDDEHKHRAYRKLQIMTQYANTQGCLQQFILKYFGEASPACGRCSNCTDDRTAQDITTDAQKVLSCVVRLHSRFGKGVVAQVLTGANNQRIRESNLSELSTYGLMANQRQKSVSELIDFLMAAGYLQAVGGQYPTLSVTQEGAGVLKGQTQVYRKTARTVKQSVPENSALFEQLRTLRRNLAEEQGVPPFVIFSDKTLHSMCDVMPTTDDAFLTVRGVGESKLEKYGETFMATIRAAATADVTATTPTD